MDRNESHLDHIGREAAEWFVELQDPAEATRCRADFVKWLLRSPQHLEEFLAVTRVWGDVELARLDSYCRDALIEAARAHLQSDNVVTSVAFGRRHGTSHAAEPGARRWTARPIAIVAAAAALLVAGALTWFVANGRGDPSNIQTAIGEQRSVTLGDGSIVTLNTNSELVVHLQPAERHIELLRGEARFKVAKDTNRPFIVRTPQATVRALGTIFNVHAGNERTEVAVMEGRIELRDRVDRAPRAESPRRAVERIELEAGQRAAVVAGRDILRDVGPPIERVAAWTERRLVFRQEALADVVAEFNRYHERSIWIDDARLAGVRISGSFDSSDPSSLIEYLERFEQVRVEERQDGTHLLP